MEAYINKIVKLRRTLFSEDTYELTQDQVNIIGHRALQQDYIYNLYYICGNVPAQIAHCIIRYCFVEYNDVLQKIELTTKADFSKDEIAEEISRIGKIIETTTELKPRIWQNGWSGYTDDLLETLLYPEDETKRQVRMHDAWAFSRLYTFESGNANNGIVKLTLKPLSLGIATQSLNNINKPNDKSKVLIGIPLDRDETAVIQERWLVNMVDFRGLTKDEQDKDKVPAIVFNNFDTEKDSIIEAMTGAPTMLGLSAILNKSEQEGGKIKQYKKTNERITFGTTSRIVYKKGQKKFVKYNGVFMAVADVRAMQKHKKIKH